MRKAKLLLFNDISGNDVNINLYHYGQGENRLYIQGGIHGGEVTYYIFNELHDWLIKNEKKLKGTITLLPIVNPPAWNQRMYYYTMGKFDFYKGKDWNRSYLGTDTTLSARNSEKIFRLAKKYEFCLDLHTARTSKPYTIFNDLNILKYLRDFGLKYNFFINPDNPNYSLFNGTLTDALFKAKVKSFACECGSHDSLEPENVSLVTNSITNLIDSLGILKGTMKPSMSQQFRLNQISTIYSNDSGFIKYNFEPHQKFKKGQVLGEIFNSSQLGNTSVLIAESDGIMFELAKTHIAWTGDEVMRVVYNNNIEKLV